ncbi:MAG: ATP synthase F1 subunit epsilon [Lachnospiraceae bacterium]
MAEMFRLQIITPEEKFYIGEASMVELTTTEGDVGIYKHHIPMTAIVAPGILTIHEAEQEKKAALMSGFIEVLPEEITILAEVAEWPEEIDVNRAREAKVRAERRLSSHAAEVDPTRAELALKRALVRLELKE